MHQLRAKIDSLSTEIAEAREAIDDLELFLQDLFDSSTPEEESSSEELYLCFNRYV